MSDFDITESIGHLFLQISRLHRNKMQEALGKIKLHPGQEFVIFHLGQQDGLTQSELALRLQIQPPTLTRMLDRMESTGFVRRQTDPDDQRISRVFLTPEGLALKRHILEIWEEVEKTVLAGFSGKKRKVLRKLLGRVYLNLL